MSIYFCSLDTILKTMASDSVNLGHVIVCFLLVKGKKRNTHARTPAAYVTRTVTHTQSQ